MNYTRFDDVTLLRLMAGGQTEALSELYDRYGRLVYSVAYRALGDGPAAEEITQDTFMRIWQHAGDYQPELGKVAGWLASIARHRAIDVYRHGKSRHEGDGVSLEELEFFDPPGEQNVEQEADQASQTARVRRAVAKLPLEQRQALELAYFRGLTHEEIAQALSEPLGTIKTRIRLGMQKLRQLLQEELKV